LIPIFQQQWKEKTGQEVEFEESDLGSGAQSRAVVEGFEADIVALSLEADVIRIADAGLITSDWKSGQYKGMVSTSIVSASVASPSSSLLATQTRVPSSYSALTRMDSMG
jgi:sulfate transport system substrate-binding protein